MPSPGADAARPHPVEDGGAVRSWRGPARRPDPERILRVHGYRDPGRVRPVIRHAAETAADSAGELSAPEAAWTTAPITSLRAGELTLLGGVSFHCPAFDEHLAGCERLLAFVATIGPGLDRRVAALVHDGAGPLDGLFLETAGWLAIEAATRDLTQALKAEAAAAGRRLTLRLGPGYDYPAPSGAGRVRWDLTEQAQLFAVFGDAALPVALTEVSAMLPKMSRSGVFGMRRTAPDGDGQASADG